MWRGGNESPFYTPFPGKPESPHYFTWSRVETGASSVNFLGPGAYIIGEELLSGLNFPPHCLS